MHYPLFTGWFSRRTERQQLATQEQHLESKLEKLDKSNQGTTSSYDATPTNGPSAASSIHSTPSASPVDETTAAWKKSASSSSDYTSSSSSHWKLPQQEARNDAHTQDSQNEEVPRYTNN